MKTLIVRASEPRAGPWSIPAILARRALMTSDPLDEEDADLSRWEDDGAAPSPEED